jgi:hypothetical protein
LYLNVVSRNWFNADAIGILRGKYSSPFLAIKIGEKAIRKCLREQLGVLCQDTAEKLGEYPTMMGEIGVPYDLDRKQAYRSGDYSNQTRAWDASLNACDGANALSYTLWTYCPDNLHAWGDRWNGEDLSIWSKDDTDRLLGSRRRMMSGSRESSIPGTPIYFTPNSSSTLLTVMDNLRRRDPSPTPSPLLELNDGARALAAICRPYPVAIVGRPIDIEFDIKTSEFVLKVQVAADDVLDPSVPTEIYVPHVHYAAFPREVVRDARQDEGYPSSPSALSVNEDKDKVVGSGRITPSPSTDGNSDLDDKSSALALEVEVSSGNWEVKGQTLKWFYTRPSEGQAPVEGWIRIRRAGGAISAWQKQCEFSFHYSFLSSF